MLTMLANTTASMFATDAKIQTARGHYMLMLTQSPFRPTSGVLTQTGNDCPTFSRPTAPPGVGAAARTPGGSEFSSFCSTFEDLFQNLYQPKPLNKQTKLTKRKTNVSGSGDGARVSVSMRRRYRRVGGASVWARPRCGRGLPPIKVKTCRILEEQLEVRPEGAPLTCVPGAPLIRKQIPIAPVQRHR